MCKCHGSLYIYVSIKVTKYHDQDKLWKEGLMVPEGSGLPSQWGNMAAGRHGGRNSWETTFKTSSSKQRAIWKWYKSLSSQNLSQWWDPSKPHSPTLPGAKYLNAWEYKGTSIVQNYDISLSGPHRVIAISQCKIYSIQLIKPCSLKSQHCFKSPKFLLRPRQSLNYNLL